MKQVGKRVAERRKIIEAHPFFSQMADESIDCRERLLFAPIVIDFVMGFADMNKWYLNYERAEDPHREAINIHAAEDQTHSVLFIEDWYKLELAKSFPWRADETLWFNLLCSETEVVRSFGMLILDYATRYPSPSARFAMIESMEAFGDVMFSFTEPVAVALEAQTGREYRYWGTFHRRREDGHLQGADETIFTQQVLAEDERATCLWLVDEMFDNFEALLDRAHSFACRARRSLSTLTRELREERDLYLGAVGPELTVKGKAREPLPDSVVGHHLDAHCARLRKSALCTWLEGLADCDVHEAQSALAAFVPLWCTDFVGYADFMDKVLRLPQPSGVNATDFNIWTEQLAQRSRLYLRDWKALELNERLDFTSGECICFSFLSHYTEPHRLAMAQLKKWAFAYPDVAQRYWLVRALESAYAVLTAATAPLARRIEEAEGVELAFFADRYDFLAGANAIVPNATDEKRVCRMIDDIFRYTSELFVGSEEVGREKLLVKGSSEVVPLQRRDFLKL